MRKKYTLSILFFASFYSNASWELQRTYRRTFVYAFQAIVYSVYFAEWMCYYHHEMLGWYTIAPLVYIDIQQLWIYSHISVMSHMISKRFRQIVDLNVFCCMNDVNIQWILFIDNFIVILWSYLIIFLKKKSGSINKQI